MRLTIHCLLLSVFFVLGLSSTVRYCRTGSDDVAPDPNFPGLQGGNMNLLRFGIKRPWPPIAIPKKGDIRLIRYCFANAKAKAELNCLLQKGFKIWTDAIGTPASAENGHSLGWMEVHDGNPNKDERTYPSCYLDDYKDRAEPGTWHPKLSPDVLAIHLGGEEVPYASTGYDFRQTTTPGRHFLVMGPSSTEAHQVAHEIGHIIGMLHEHCRFDRDDHVIFRCEKLLGYQAALIAASVAGHADAANRLCTEQVFANQFGFEAGAQYVKNDAYSFVPAAVMDEGAFDLGSIMIYPSNAYAADTTCWEQSNTAVCPLVASRFGTTWAINVNTAPSRGDVDFVKQWYKWIDPLPEPPAQESLATASHLDKRRGQMETRSVVKVHRLRLRSGNVVVKEL